MRGMSRAELSLLVERAIAIKNGEIPEAIRGQGLVSLFFNQSLRTRLSMEEAMTRFGGRASSLSPGSDSWKFEFDDGVLMNADKAEHVKEAARVISRYTNALGVRSFADLRDLEEDAKDSVLNGFARYASVPVINLESAMEHPCQALADMVTIREKLKEPIKKRFVLSWAPHVKPLPLAVPHSAALAGLFSGMDVVVAAPKGYGFEPGFQADLQRIAGDLGVSFSFTEDQLEATREADILYVKSWGAPKFYREPRRQVEDFAEHHNWCVTKEHLGKRALLMHCLPVRRNLVVADDALDSEQSIIIDQAENRLWAQAAIMESIFKGKNGV